VIARRETADAGPDCLDDAGSLVATAKRQVANGDVTGREVIVRVTQARGAHPHQHLVLTRFVEFDGADFPFPGNLPE
jgi:hypothetical protein